MHICIMGSRNIKEMQMREGDGEEKKFGSSDGAWLNRKGPFCFSAPSLQPLFVNFHHFIASLPLQHSLVLEYLFECLFAELKASLVIVSLRAHKHLSGVYGCQDTWWFAKGIWCLCRGGSLKGVQSEPTLGLIMFIREWWAFETDSGGWFDGCGVERASVQ